MKYGEADFPDSVTQRGEKYTIAQGWGYRNPDGSILFWRIRYNGQFNKEKGKNDKVFRAFYMKDNKLIMKQPPGIAIPPLKADALFIEKKKPFILVEGEKCATCQTAKNIEDEGFIVTTLAGPANKCDISILKNREGYYIPDNDESGMKKAEEVKKLLPKVKIIPPFPEWGKGQSIDDFDISGNDFLDYLETCDFITFKKENPRDSLELDKIKVPFLFLGFDEKSYWFIPQRQNIPIKIGRGNNNLKNYIEEIAPRAFWLDKFGMETERGIDINLPVAMAFVRELSYKKGIFNEEKLLGVGPHRDGDRILINTGKSILVYNGGEIAYNDYDGDLLFVRSKFKFEINGKPWTMDDRKKFIEQVRTFTFEKYSQMLAVVGWCAVAPFASLLNRRPHIWLTAAKGTGKTHFIDNIIEPAIGEFLIKIEGKTSEAGVRQSIGRDCRPVILDEFESNNKHENATLENILGLARSAYGGSDIVKGSPGHAAIKFSTKMMFCFSSVKTYLSNAANASRIAVIRMKKSNGRMTGTPPMEGLKAYIYDNLERLLETVDAAKKEILAQGYDERTGDTYGPLFAGFWLIVSDEPFMHGKPETSNFVMSCIKEIGHEGPQEDEDRVLSYIFDRIVRVDANTSVTVAEMLNNDDAASYSVDGVSLKYDAELRRIGMRRMRRKINGEDKEVLAIACSHQEIVKILEETAFVEYKDVLSRHRAFLRAGKEKYPTVHMAGKNNRSILLDWDMIHKEYFEGENSGESPF